MRVCVCGGGGGWQTHCEGKYRITYDSSGGLYVTDEQNKSKIYLYLPTKCDSILYLSNFIIWLRLTLNKLN